MPTHIVAVGGIVENEQGDILLVRHVYDGSWACPGGQVEVGENIIDALVREIFEESGIHVAVDRLYWIGSNILTHPGHSGVEIVPTKVIFNFICTFLEGELRGSNETSEVCWVKREQVMDRIDIAFRDRFQAYLEYNGTVQYMEYASRPYELKLKRNI